MGIFGSRDSQPVDVTDDTSMPMPDPATALPAPDEIGLPDPGPMQQPYPAQAQAQAPMDAASNFVMTPVSEPPAAPAYQVPPPEPAPAAQSAPVGPAIPEPQGIPEPDFDGLNGSDLSSIKQQALQQLSPLVNHLDQSPEERFQTTMMMLQATDDQTLIKEAYEVAQEITDEKARAQALLDIINEINYFTQHKSG